MGSMGVGRPPDPEVVFNPSLLCQFRSISGDSSCEPLLDDSKSIGLDKLDCACNKGGFSFLETYPRNLAKCFFLGEVSFVFGGKFGVVGADLAAAWLLDSLIFCSLAKVLLSGACGL